MKQRKCISNLLNTMGLSNGNVKLVTVVVLAIIVTTYGPAHAVQTNDLEADRATAGIKGEGSPEMTWREMVPQAVEYDWIQLTSKEWLKGVFESLYDDKVEFDSDELDLVVLDWEDVEKVRGHSIHSVFIE